jgi:hypothetical protein
MAGDGKVHDGRRPDSDMQRIVNHLDNVVRPALRRYATAEAALTATLVTKPRDEASVQAARGEAMRTARAAANELHHLTDFALHNPPPTFADIAAVRAAVQAHVTFLREPRAAIPDDVALLRDIAEAFKHYKLDRRSATVTDASSIAAISTGYGVARWGEGKWGGVEQVIVERKDGDKRALSSVLQNVFDAWLSLLGQPLPPINDF